MIEATPSRIVDVLTPVALDQAWSYRVPEGMALSPGDFVYVPLGPRTAVGVVWEVRAGSGDNLKSVGARLAPLHLPGPLRALIDWLAQWTLAPRGMVLRMVMRAPLGAEPEAPGKVLRQIGEAPARLTPARAKVLEALAATPVLSRSALREAAGVSAGVISGLISEGTLAEEDAAPLPAPAAPDPDFAIPTFEGAQAEAVAALRLAVDARAFRALLLEGVTGSGKTEVYFEAVAQALRAGGQVMILIPEIALTTQFLARFAARFGVEPGLWHSGVTPRKRADLWNAVADGTARVVAGARSALFLPFADLRLIIVDEEHEAAYKQGEGVTYNARDMAVVRARFEKALAVLASATPSLESRVNAAQGRYGHLRLPTRFADRALPGIAAIDMRREGPAKGHWLAPRLVGEMAETFARGEQVLLFLNRRGYAPLTLCRACGHRFQCPHCSAWLVEHRFRRILVCHHCGHSEPRPNICPSCDSEDSLTACGPGVERLAEETAALFPEARTIVLSSDLGGGTERLRHEIDRVTRGEVDLIIGTQMVAKGHHFPKLTLVGVVDADVGLANGDPRAGERTFQMLQQVTGRAGRGGAAGRGLLQSWQPEHPVMAALLTGDSEAFYERETDMRALAGLPPFGRLAALIVSGTDAATTQRHARALVLATGQISDNPRWKLAPMGGLPQDDEVVVLGPAEAPVALLRGRFRFRILVKAPRNADLQGFLRALLTCAPPARGNIRVVIDVDPQSFM